MVLLAAGTLWIVGFAPMKGSQLTYKVLLKSSGGVRRGDRIRVSGVQVGRIKEMDLNAGDEWPVALGVTVNERVELREGSSARITADGLLGAPYLEIVVGPMVGELLPPGGRIYESGGGTISQTLEDLGEVTVRFPALLDEATTLLGSLSETLEPLRAGLEVFLSEENAAAFSGTLAALQPTLEEVGPKMSALISRLDSLTAKLEEGIEGVPELSHEMNALVGDLRQAMGPDGQRLADVLDSAKSTLSSADGALSTVEDNRQEVDAMLRDLREAAANLRSLTQTIKERPSLLLRSPKTKEREKDSGGGS